VGLDPPAAAEDVWHLEAREGEEARDDGDEGGDAIATEAHIAAECLEQRWKGGAGRRGDMHAARAGAKIAASRNGTRSGHERWICTAAPREEPRRKKAAHAGSRFPVNDGTSSKKATKKRQLGKRR